MGKSQPRLPPRALCVHRGALTDLSVGSAWLDKMTLATPSCGRTRFYLFSFFFPSFYQRCLSPLVLSASTRARTTATFSSSVHRARALPSALRTLRGCSVAPARAMTAEVTAAEVAALEAELAGMALPPVGTEVRSRGCTPALPCALLRRLLPSLLAG